MRWGRISLWVRFGSVDGSASLATRKLITKRFPRWRRIAIRRFWSNKQHVPAQTLGGSAVWSRALGNRQRWWRASTITRRSATAMRSYFPESTGPSHLRHVFRRASTDGGSLRRGPDSNRSEVDAGRKREVRRLAEFRRLYGNATSELLAACRSGHRCRYSTRIDLITRSILG